MHNKRFDEQRYRDNVVEKENEDHIGNGCSLHQIRVELTHDCPLNCLHCSACASNSNPSQLPIERVVSLINEFAEMGGKEVVFTGGEPLVYPGLLRVLESSNTARLKSIVYTSGATRERRECICINDEELVRMKPLLSRIVFSLYSLSEGSHNQITRTENSFEITLKAIRKSINLGITTDVHFVPMKINYGDLYSIAELCYALGVQKIRILRFVPHGRGKGYADDLLPTVNDYRIFAQLIESTERIYPGFLDIGAAFSALISSVSKGCSAAEGKIVVTADGYIAPCDGFKNFDNPSKVWNINNKPLVEIYTYSPLLRLVRMAKNGNAKGEQSNIILEEKLGCMAQKSLAHGFVTCLGLDPCMSDKPLYEEVNANAL
jgi:MoaA/NifB/PqqE/SkfB family radical SAM enzyme